MMNSYPSTEAALVLALQQDDRLAVEQALSRSPSWSAVHYDGEHPLAYALRQSCSGPVVEQLIEAAPKPLGELRVLVQGQAHNMVGFVLGRRAEPFREIKGLLEAGLSVNDMTVSPRNKQLTPMRAWLRAFPSDLLQRDAWRAVGHQLIHNGASVQEPLWDHFATGLTLLHELAQAYVSTSSGAQASLYATAQWLVKEGLSPHAVAHGGLTGSYPHGEFTALDLLRAGGLIEDPLVAFLSAYELGRGIDETRDPVVAATPARRPRL